MVPKAIKYPIFTKNVDLKARFGKALNIPPLNGNLLLNRALED
jgi:hypothetical protein